MDVKLLWGANKDALPTLIREEFEKIEFQFFKKSAKPVLEVGTVFSALCDLQMEHKLYENIFPDDNDENFILLSNKRYGEMWNEYRNGFVKGYEELHLKDDVFNNEKNIINRIFSGIYNVFEDLTRPIAIGRTDHHPLLIWFDHLDYLALEHSIQSTEKTFLCIDNHFYEYGQEVGKYVKCWDIILNNPTMFEDIFDNGFMQNNKVEKTQKGYNKTHLEAEIKSSEEGTKLMDEDYNCFNYLQFDDPRKHQKILSDDDFDRLMGWIKAYFDNDLTVPKITVPIMKVNTAKGNIFQSFKEFYKYKFPHSSYPDSLWEFIKTAFFPYRNDKPENMAKSKKPDYYDSLVIKQKKTNSP